MKRVKSMLYGLCVWALLASSASNATAIYDVDDDRDGRSDRQLILEHSDSLA